MKKGKSEHRLFRIRPGLLIALANFLLLVSPVLHAGTLTVNNGASLTGTGTLQGDLLVKPGGSVVPGIACLAVNNASFSLGSSLTIGISGTTACANHARLQVNGTIDLGQATLSLATNAYSLQLNDEIIVVANDGADPISSIFNQLPEQQSFLLDGNEVFMSYVTGTGNDAGFKFKIVYAVGGMVTGLALGNAVGLQNNGSDGISVSANTSFVFSTQDDGSDYAVSVSGQPTTPNQLCSVSGGNGVGNNGSGTLAGANDNSVMVSCTTLEYSIGGTVTGLTSGNQLILDMDNGDSLILGDNGAYQFASVPDTETGFDYVVTISTQPSSPSQVCLVTNGSGTMLGSSVGNVDINCNLDLLFSDSFESP